MSVARVEFGQPHCDRCEARADVIARLAQRVRWLEAQLALSRALRGERDRARDLAARLEAQLAQIADLHAQHGIYDECDCDDKSTTEHLPFDEFATCLPLDYLICRACCVDNGFQTEACAAEHEHSKDKPRCATVAILDGAL